MKEKTARGQREGQTTAGLSAGTGDGRRETGAFKSRPTKNESNGEKRFTCGGLGGVRSF